MVKITNKFGDVKQGKQHTVVYQGHYGNQMRRMLKENKDEHTRGQLEQRDRFRTGIDFAKGLTKAQRDFIKSYMTEAGIKSPDGLPTTWFTFTKKIAMTRPKVEMETEAGGGFSGTYANWDHRTPITLNNTSGGELTNYQTLITLTTENFNYDNCKADGSDIRFSQDDETTPLPYWIEDWNYNGTSKLWVKVDSIPTGSNICLYLYYGNASAESESNGNNTAKFFDDFENGLNWVEDETLTGGSVALESSIVKSGAYSTKHTYDTGNTSFFRAIGTINSNVAIEFYRQVNSTTEIAKIMLIIGQAHINTNQITLISFSADGKINYYDGEWHVIMNYSANTWYKFKLCNFNFSTHTFDIYIDNNLKVTGAKFRNNFSYFDNFELYSHSAGSVTYIDRIFIRKYASPEPTSEIGEEGPESQETILKKLKIKHTAIKSYKIMNNEDIITSIEGISNLEDHISTVVTETDLNLTATKIKVKTLANQEYEFIVK